MPLQIYFLSLLPEIAKTPLMVTGTGIHHYNQCCGVGPGLFAGAGAPGCCCMASGFLLAKK